MSRVCSGCGQPSPYDEETIEVDGLWIVEVRHVLDCADCGDVWTDWYNPLNRGSWHERTYEGAFSCTLDIQKIFSEQHPHTETAYRVRQCGVPCDGL